MQAYAVFLMGVIIGIAGVLFLLFRARKTVSHELMLGVAMSLIGATMAIVGGIAVLFS